VTTSLSDQAAAAFTTALLIADRLDDAREHGWPVRPDTRPTCDKA
jgi:hypothetical protein